MRTNGATLRSAALWLAVAGAPTAIEPDRREPLNLLIIQTDEHSFRTLGCYRETLPTEQALMWGEAVVETPNIDWIASQGALCTSFYATTPVCSPSRAAFVSGQYPHNTSVVANNDPMDDDVVTFAELLGREGYATGFFGKWHLDGVGRPRWAPKRKFGFEDNRYMFNRGHWKQIDDSPTGLRVATGVEHADEKSYPTDFLTDRTIEFIEQHKGGPFCAYLSLLDPHDPDVVRPPYDTMFADQVYERPRTHDVQDSDLPVWGKTGAGVYPMDQYYGMVRCIDDNVGKLIETLRSADLLERTIIVFTSDHGDLRGEHHRQDKGVPYEASARIPFLMTCPGKIRGGTVIDAALTSVDFQPTVLALMGQEPSGREEGRDASALFTSPEASAAWTDIAFMRRSGEPSEQWLAAITDRYKLVLSPWDMPWLFDLVEDPDERTNFFLGPGYRETVRRLSMALVEYGSSYGDPHLRTARIDADLEWAIHGTDPYSPPPEAWGLGPIVNRLAFLLLVVALVVSVVITVSRRRSARAPGSF